MDRGPTQGCVIFNGLGKRTRLIGANLCAGQEVSSNKYAIS